MSRILVVLAGLAALLMQPERAAAQSRKGETPLISAIGELVKKQGITEAGPGVAILVTQGGKVVFQKGYGLAHLEHRAPITPQTLFELASVSKSFTATAILILHERGRLSVEDDVRKYVPELPEYSKQHPIRVRDLLHHVSGLPDYMEFEDFPARHKDYWTNEDYAGEFARHRKKMPLRFPTGGKYEYNNSNYMLLGLIVKRVSKRSFGKFLHEAIFVPAGMKNTFVYESPEAVPVEARRLVHAIGYEKGKAGEWRAAWGTPPERHEKLLTVGDGAIWTNLEDMAHWDLALRDHTLIKMKTMDLALTPSETRDGKKNTYGFGWSVYPNDAGGLNGFGHEGSWGGFKTSYYQYVVADRTTVVLSNRGDFDPDKFWYALNDAIEKHSATGR